MKTWAKWLLVGLLSIALGAFALGHAVLVSVSVTMLVGILLGVAGVLQIGSGITDPGLGNKIWNVLLGMMMVVLGISFSTNPLEGTISLALLVTIFIATGGVLRMFLAWQMRQTQYFWAMLVSGSFSILLAALIFADFERVSVALLGTLLGIELIFSGVSLVVLALFKRKYPDAVAKLTQTSKD